MVFLHATSSQMMILLQCFAYLILSRGLNIYQSFSLFSDIAQLILMMIRRTQLLWNSLPKRRLWPSYLTWFYIFTKFWYCPMTYHVCLFIWWRLFLLQHFSSFWWLMHTHVDSSRLCLLMVLLYLRQYYFISEVHCGLNTILISFSLK